MRALIQRVTSSSVSVSGKIKSEIAAGLLVLVSFETDDTLEDLAWTAAKIVQLRIFKDEVGLMNRSLKEINGELLIVSQFTLHALTKKGNRPSFIRAAKPDKAIPLYEKFVHLAEQDLGKPVRTGIFGADMQVALLNDGPVTIWIDSKNRE